MLTTNGREHWTLRGRGYRERRISFGLKRERSIRRRNVSCPVSTTLFLLFQKPGPSWVPGRTTREQPLWQEHARFIDRLFDEGRIVLGGPYADYSRALLVVQAQDAEEVRSLFREDPWATNGILVPQDVIEWTIFVDSRRRAE
jgi:uncharacterized protein YciI